MLLSARWQVICNTTYTVLVIKGPEKYIETDGRMDAFCRQKGVEHALDHRGDSIDFVVVGISRWLYGWWTHSYPAGHRDRRCADPSHPGTKVMVAIWTLAGEGEEFGKEVFSRSRKILPNLWMPSSEKVSQLTLS